MFMEIGIDISFYQGKVDFNKVKNDGIKFVILRSSYRQTTDTRFFEYVKGCKAAGIDIRGVYHFIYALSSSAAREEAKYCVQQVKKAGLPKNTYIFADFEYDTVDKAAAKGVRLTPNECDLFTRSFCEEVEKAGYKTGIYANIDYYKNWYNDKTIFDKYPLWLADLDGGPDFPCIMQQYGGHVKGINGEVDMDNWFGEVKDMKVRSRQKVVDLVTSWKGLNEADGSYKKIIDIYNSYKGKLPRGVKMQYGWAWCACTWSAVAIALGYTDVMPIEIGCEELIKVAKKMGCWVENDAYVPDPADGILYDWDDNGVGDCTGYADHIGTVINNPKKDGYILVIEGNYKDMVTTRKLAINGRYIRGFVTPKYTDSMVTNTTVKEVSEYMFKPKTVKMGSSGTSVLLLQEILRARGFLGKDKKALDLDRSAGTNTIYALNAYKKSRGMTQDGICDATTWADLIAI